MVEKLDCEIEKELLDEISNTIYNSETFRYQITDDGQFIHLSSTIGNPNFETLSNGVVNVEKILNVKFVHVSSNRGVHTFTYEFI